MDYGHEPLFGTFITPTNQPSVGGANVPPAGPNGQAKTTFVIACSRSSDPHSSPPELS